MATKRYLTAHGDSTANFTFKLRPTTNSSLSAIGLESMRTTTPTHKTLRLHFSSFIAPGEPVRDDASRLILAVTSAKIVLCKHQVLVLKWAGLVIPYVCP